MQLILKTFEGQFQELGYTVGSGGAGVVGINILRVSFDYKDTDDVQTLVHELEVFILPRMPKPTDEDFLPMKEKA